MPDLVAFHITRFDWRESSSTLQLELTRQDDGCVMQAHFEGVRGLEAVWPLNTCQLEITDKLQLGWEQRWEVEDIEGGPGHLTFTAKHMDIREMVMETE